MTLSTPVMSFNGNSGSPNITFKWNRGASNLWMEISRGGSVVFDGWGTWSGISQDTVVTWTDTSVDRDAGYTYTYRYHNTTTGEYGDTKTVSSYSGSMNYGTAIFALDYDSSSGCLAVGGQNINNLDLLSFDESTWTTTFLAEGSLTNYAQQVSLRPVTANFISSVNYEYPYWSVHYYDGSTTLQKMTLPTDTETDPATHLPRYQPYSSTAWTPDGQYIVTNRQAWDNLNNRKIYYLNTSGTPSVSVVTLSGLANSSNSAFLTNFSHNGQYMAETYNASAGAVRSAIYSINKTSTTTWTLTPVYTSTTVSLGACIFSPDDQYITSGSVVFYFNGSSVTALTTSGLGTFTAGRLAFSPDSTKLALGHVGTTANTHPTTAILQLQGSGTSSSWNKTYLGPTEQSAFVEKFPVALTNSALLAPSTTLRNTMLRRSASASTPVLTLAQNNVPNPDLSWTHDSGASNVVLKRLAGTSGSPGLTGTTIYTDTGTSAFTDSGLTPGNYRYQVAVTDQFGVVQYSNIVQVAVTAPPADTTPPDPPVLSGDTNATANSLSWAGTGDSVSYRIYRDGTLIATQSGSTYTDTLDTTVSHSYYVTARDAAGNWSFNSNTVTLQYTAPEEPPDEPPPDTTAPDVAVLSGENVDSGSNSLSWVGASDAVSYRIYRDGTLIATQSGTTFTDTVDATQSHTYTVRSSDSAGNWSGDSNSVTLQYTAPPPDEPPADTTPPDPATLSGENIDSTHNSLSWSGASDAVSYRIYRDGTLIATQSGTTFSDNVDATSPHTYIVLSADAAGNWSGNSNSVTLQYVAPPPEEPPPDVIAPDVATLSGNNVSATQNSLSWTGASDATLYRIYRDGQLIAQQSGTTYTDNTTASTAHSYTVRSADSVGNWSGDSNTVTLQYVDTTPPNAPMLTGQNISSTTNTLSWSTISDAANYSVYKDGQLLATTTNTHYDDTTIQDSAPHTYTVKARDAAGNVSIASNSVTLQYTPPAPVDTTPPDPQILSGSTPQSMENDLSWTASSDAVRYALYRDGVSIGSFTTTSFKDILDASVQHTYTVRGQDAAGNWSAMSNAVTLKYVPPIPNPIVSAEFLWDILGQSMGRDPLTENTIGREPLSDQRRLDLS